MRNMLSKTVYLILFSAIEGNSQCTVNATMPGPFLSAGTPIAWPHPNLPSAPGFVGYVTYTALTSGIICYSTTDCRPVLVPAPTEYEAMDTAFRNWTDASVPITGNGTGAAFRYSDFDPPVYNGCTVDGSIYPQCPQPIYPFIKFYKDPDQYLNGNDAITGSSFWQYGGNAYGDRVIPDYWRLQFAWIDYSDALGNKHYLTHTFAHEIGHTMALDDCEVCNIYTTVMTSHSLVRNELTLALEAPGPCDQQQVGATNVAAIWKVPSIFFSFAKRKEYPIGTVPRSLWHAEGDAK